MEFSKSSKHLIFSYFPYLQLFYTMANSECWKRRWVYPWFSFWYWGGQTTFCQTLSLVSYTGELFYSSIVSYFYFNLRFTVIIHLIQVLLLSLKLHLSFQEYKKHCQNLESKSLISPSIQSSTTRSIHRTDGPALRVYTDIPHVEEFLKRPEFVISMCSVSLFSILLYISFNVLIFFDSFVLMCNMPIVFYVK